MADKVQEQLFKARDWSCESCLTINRAIRSRCRNCQGERPAAVLREAEADALASNLRFLRDLDSQMRMSERMINSDVELHVTGETAESYIDAFNEAGALRSLLVIARHKLSIARWLLAGFWLLAGALITLRLFGI